MATSRMPRRAPGRRTSIIPEIKGQRVFPFEKASAEARAQADAHKNVLVSQRATGQKLAGSARSLLALFPSLAAPDAEIIYRAVSERASALDSRRHELASLRGKTYEAERVLVNEQYSVLFELEKRLFKVLQEKQ